VLFCGTESEARGHVTYHDDKLNNLGLDSENFN
jgi:hypothetical protein